LADAASYQSSVDRTAATQTTSPAPTLAQDQAAATEAGKIAASQASPNPPPVLEPVQNLADFDPNIPTPITQEIRSESTTNNSSPSNQVTGIVDIGAFDPNVTTSREDIKTVSNDEVRNLLRKDAENIIQENQRDVTTDGEIGNFQAADAQASQDQLVVNVTTEGIKTVDLISGTTYDAETINPGSDPNIRPGTIIYDDGSSLYYDPNTGETITTDTDGNTSSSILIPTTDSTENNSLLSATSTLPNRNQQSGIGSPKDWRFRMSLAPSANYLYKAATPGILKPLLATNGVIFPYSPQINVSYNASYSSSDLVHTNYKIYNYKNSSIESIGITGEFTCQDSAEANYVLAVIHFFKSVTKMFYGQDQNPPRGTPPPLVYLSGFGQYQFDMHPVVVTSFTHTFPADVDYVNAYPTNNSVSIGGQNMAPYMPQIATFFSPLDRLRTLASNIVPGGRAPPPTFINSKNINEVTRVPAKITIQLTCLPIITRQAMSNAFSLQKYASGELMRGSVNFGKTGGGIW
jgi:hypothetical protein